MLGLEADFSLLCKFTNKLIELYVRLSIYSARQMRYYNRYNMRLPDAEGTYQPQRHDCKNKIRRKHHKQNNYGYIFVILENYGQNIMNLGELWK